MTVLTDHRKLEAELKQAQKRLETIANACRRHVLSGVATSNHHLIVSILRLAEDAREKAQ